MEEAEVFDKVTIFKLSKHCRHFRFNFLVFQYFFIQPPYISFNMHAWMSSYTVTPHPSLIKETVLDMILCRVSTDLGGR